MTDSIIASELTRYHGGLLAGDHVNFEVQQGEIFGYLGPNGAGKTTTIKMLTGLLRPIGGTAYIEGHDILHDLHQIKRVIGIVPEVSNVYDEQEEIADPERVVVLSSFGELLGLFLEAGDR